MSAAANRIIRPYSIDVKEVVWWSIYDIGHSITDKFDDVSEGSPRSPRVFTAGDACHTHSPKAGQGMNVSMQDTFNLGWKLVHVLQGRADASLLRSYSKERLTEARRLVSRVRCAFAHGLVNDVFKCVARERHASPFPLCAERRRSGYEPSPALCLPSSIAVPRRRRRD